ncbi:ImmA/IrrE family metallo-endopeptidase [Lactobacillus sp. W8093]|uniref:ImmA/IrrE family metallo-endopeptidase n=1 Tax=Lactobacillus sp. W8093 TaxID=2751038 RepID=UPI0018EFAE68|nr:ImmA/IrrE family metallo-endopeptidase [Lactobacillus sp. W8093]MBI0110911.1 ImmA/IrrE family metallo-endopeptidase [Lactobacillus sp. W8093]
MSRIPPLSVKKLKKIDRTAQKIHYDVFGTSDHYDDIENYLEYQGIDVRYIISEDIDGYLRWDDKKDCPVIAVSITGNAPVRQRFTMAHELGHLILNFGWRLGIDQNNAQIINGFKHSNKKFLNILSYRGKEYTPEEQEVDEFAGAFLIPTNKLSKLVNEFVSNDVKDPEQSANQLAVKVSQTFKVSLQTATLRLRNYLRELQNE